MIDVYLVARLIWETWVAVGAVLFVIGVIALVIIIALWLLGDD